MVTLPWTITCLVQAVHSMVLWEAGFADVHWLLNPLRIALLHQGSEGGGNCWNSLHQHKEAGVWMQSLAFLSGHSPPPAPAPSFSTKLHRLCCINVSQIVVSPLINFLLLLIQNSLIAISLKEKFPGASPHFLHTAILEVPSLHSLYFIQKSDFLSLISLNESAVHSDSWVHFPRFLCFLHLYIQLISNCC